jgi:hypothetical protein
MKFFAEPNFFVRVSSKPLQRLTNLKSIVFDDKGEYVTENPHVIKALKTQFKFEEEQPEVIIEDAIEEVVEVTEEKPKRSVKK